MDATARRPGERRSLVQWTMNGKNMSTVAHTAWQKENAVPVEHVMAGVKRLNILKEKIRLCFQNVRDQGMLIACGLHNLRTIARTT